MFLEADAPEIVIAGEADSLSSARSLIEHAAPDIVLLDVDLGDGTGFDLLNLFPQPGFRVIFTTAHDEFALRAFRYSAIDYLLKPVDPEDLISAVRRASQPVHQPDPLICVTSDLTIPGTFGYLEITLRRDASTIKSGAKIANAVLYYEDTPGNFPQLADCQPGQPNATVKHCLASRLAYTKKNSPTPDYVGDWQFVVKGAVNGRVRW